jgi:hypothetical protein
LWLEQMKENIKTNEEIKGRSEDKMSKKERI